MHLKFILNLINPRDSTLSTDITLHVFINKSKSSKITIACYIYHTYMLYMYVIYLYILYIIYSVFHI